MSERWPTELRISKDRARMTVTFDDGARHELTAEMLRVMSPSAEVQGHSPQQRKTVGGKKDVQIMQVRPVGNYAVRIVFDDMHSTGIYAWSYLDDLGRNRAEKWAAYLAELDAKGMSR